jgi:acyl-homoserine-lactone acylase
MKNRYGPIFLAIGCVLCGIATDSSQTGIYPRPGEVRILTDGYGVPHIFASQESDAMYGLGYSHAENRLKQLFNSKWTAAGRISEILGPSHLQQDELMRCFITKERVNRIYSEMKPEYRNFIFAYCLGVNDYIAANRAGIPEWIDRYEPEDLISVSLFLNGYFPLETLTRIDMNKVMTGSNQFAVAAIRSAEGHALLAFDPHMGFTGPFTFMEAQLSTPEISIVGCTIPGIPAVIMGHNGNTAWSSTKNGPDLTDIYAFRINPENPLEYGGPEGWVSFLKQNHTFKVKTPGGGKEIRKELLFTHVGPVLRISNGIAYVGRVAGYDSPGLIEQLIVRSRAKSVREHFQAYRLPGMCMMNIMAADTQGNIGYLANAVLPVRDRALDWSRPLDGADPRSEWKGLVPFEELPCVINPPSGWMQNCNDPPWNVTFGNILKKENMPFGLDSGSGIGERGLRISELLSGKDRISLEDILKYAKDTEILQARLWVPRLIAAFEKVESSASGEEANLSAAIDLLRSWDFRGEPESKGTAVFYFWYRSANVRHIVRDSQITEALLKAQLKNLGKAAAKVNTIYGRLDIPWGNILRLRHGGIEVPVSGGGGLFPVMKLGYGSLNRENKILVTVGSAYMMAVEMSPVPKAYSCFPVGINENPDNSHFADMTFLYSEMRYKPVYFTWEELKPHIESEKRLKTTPGAIFHSPREIGPRFPPATADSGTR